LGLIGSQIGADKQRSIAVENHKEKWMISLEWPWHTKCVDCRCTGCGSFASVFVGLSKDVVTSDTKLILINAIYLKGDWKKKFEKSKTVDQKFFVAENSEKQVKMMKMNSKVGYTENDQVQVLELPYVDESVTFVAFLPKEKFGLNNFIKTLNGSSLLELKSQLRQQEVNIELPRFKIESEFALKDTLTKLGLGNGFNEAVANFGGITKDDKLVISEVVHKGFVETDEEGSVAAAATAAVMTRLSMPAPPKPVPDFKADHPFLFAIFNHNRALFIGIYNSQ